MTLLPAAMILGAVALVGCTAPDPPPSLPPLPTAAKPADPARVVAGVAGKGSVDGRYSGVGTLVLGHGSSCGQQIEFWIQIVNNAFTYILQQPQVEWRRFVTLRGTVGLDGTVTAVSGRAALRATLNDGHMQGTLAGDACTWAIEADRAATW